jgi:very-short-patch-repair endonuclease
LLPLDSVIAALADNQHGVVAHFQLIALGITRDAIRHRIRTGHLHRLHPGVYAVGHRQLKPAAYRAAAVLACGPTAVLSHRSAAAHWGLRPASQAKHDVTIPGTSRQPRRSIHIHRTRLLHPDDITTHDNIPITTVPRTIIDFAATSDNTQTARVIDQAERLELFDLAALDAALARNTHRKGAKTVKQLLTAYRDPADTRSPPEDDFLDLIRSAGLPEPQVNVELEGYIVDFYWPAHRLVVEVDGYDYHNTRRRFESDRRRDAKLGVKSVRVVRYTKRRILDERIAVIEEMTAFTRNLKPPHA